MRRSLYILEGPDGVGKSTAAQALATGLEYDVKHMSKPPANFNYAEDYFGFNAYEVRLEKGQVRDRFHLGGLVYGRMCGLHPCKVTEETLLYCMLRLKYEFNAKTILMYYVSDEKYRTMIEALAAKREEMFDVEQMIRVNAMYKRIAPEALNAGSSIARIPFADVLHPVDRLGYPGAVEIESWV